MKTKKTILLSAIASLLSAYAVLYFIGVSPDSPPADEAYIKCSRGWTPSFPYYENDWCEPLSDAPIMRWNKFVHCFFLPIHLVDRVVRKDLWLTKKEKHEITLRASQPLVAPLQIYKSFFILDGGSRIIEGIDKYSTGFRIKLYRTIRMSREGIPQYFTVNDRKLERGGPEEQQLAIDLNYWLENSSGEASKYIVGTVKEMVDTISNRT